MGKAVILEKTVSLSAFSIDQTEIQNITFPEFYKNLLILKSKKTGPLMTGPGDYRLTLLKVHRLNKTA